MAMGGSMKGQNGNGNRGRKYGVMLFMAFGAAIIGVMLLHKFRERRLFNLLIRDKDHELFSLQLLLQKEIIYNKEAKGKFEEMNAKIYSLQTQNADLHDRILEMQSIISSLKDEQRITESALEEKQNEIKLLQEKDSETNQENSQVAALKETLKQKEAEIEDLKLQITVGSVSPDDLSSPAVNSTDEGSGGLIRNSTRYGDFGNSSRGAYDKSLNKSNAYRDGDNSTPDEDTTSEHSLKLGSSRDGVKGDGSSGGEKSTDDEFQAKKVKDSQNRKEVGMKGEKTNATANETIVNNGDASKTRDGYGDINAMDVEENSVAGIGGDVLQLGMEHRGGMKLEKKLDGSQASAGYRVKGKHGNPSNSREKRWRVIARNRRHWISMNAENHQDALQSGRYKRRLRDDELLKLGRHGGGHRMGLKREDESGKGSEEIEVHGDDHPQGGSSELKNDQSSGNVEVNNEIEKRFQGLDEMQANKTVEREASETARVDQSEPKIDELRKSEEGDNGDRVDKKSEEVEEVADKYEEAAEDLEVAERDFRESGPKLEEDKQESGEETDESEF